jgi:hypothetical protein
MSVLSVTIRALYQNQWGVSREYVDFFAWTFDRSEQSHVGIDNLRRVWYNESVDRQPHKSIIHSCGGVAETLCLSTTAPFAGFFRRGES